MNSTVRQTPRIGRFASHFRASGLTVIIGPRLENQPETPVTQMTHAARAQDLNDAERRVLEAIQSDSAADFTRDPGPKPQIAATFLEALISGTQAQWPALRGPLRIRGAAIQGSLIPTSDRRPEGFPALLFRDCTFDAPVDLSGLDFLSLRFVDCALPAFIGDNLTTKADLDLSGSTISGIEDYECDLSEVGRCAIHLSNARIGGRLVLCSSPRSRFTALSTVRLDGASVDGDVLLQGALLDGQGAAALSGRSMIVGGNVDASPMAEQRFEAIGEVSLSATKITGDLGLTAARIMNPAGRALHCEDLKVESIFMTARDDVPFEAAGRLNFLSATIGGGFFMTSVRLAPGPDYTGMLSKGGPVAVNLQQIRVSNTLALTNIGMLDATASPPASRSAPPVPVTGWFLLTGAQINALQDDVDTGWPAPGYLDLEGASYERLRNVNGDLVAKRIAWLRRQFPGGQPTAVLFRPQPYEMLSHVLRGQGQSTEANAIAVEKIRMRLAAGVDRPLARLFPRLLMLISHHGYSSGRAVLSFFVFMLLGVVMYSLALWKFDQAFLPIEADPVAVEYVLPLDLARIPAERGCPGLEIVQFTLDVALPVINLGQDNYCRFVPQGSARLLWSLLHSLFAIAGTALSAVVVLTLTGLLRRD